MKRLLALVIITFAFLKPASSGCVHTDYYSTCERSESPNYCYVDANHDLYNDCISLFQPEISIPDLNINNIFNPPRSQNFTPFEFDYIGSSSPNEHTWYWCEVSMNGLGKVRYSANDLKSMAAQNHYQSLGILPGGRYPGRLCLKYFGVVPDSSSYNTIFQNDNYCFGLAASFDSEGISSSCRIKTTIDSQHSVLTRNGTDYNTTYSANTSYCRLWDLRSTGPGYACKKSGYYKDWNNPSSVPWVGLSTITFSPTDIPTISGTYASGGNTKYDSVIPPPPAKGKMNYAGYGVCLLRVPPGTLFPTANYNGSSTATDKLGMNYNLRASENFYDQTYIANGQRNEICGFYTLSEASLSCQDYLFLPNTLGSDTASRMIANSFFGCVQEPLPPGPPTFNSIIIANPSPTIGAVGGDFYNISVTVTNGIPNATPTANKTQTNLIAKYGSTPQPNTTPPAGQCAKIPNGSTIPGGISYFVDKNTSPTSLGYSNICAVVSPQSAEQVCICYQDQCANNSYIQCGNLLSDAVCSGISNGTVPNNCMIRNNLAGRYKLELVDAQDYGFGIEIRLVQPEAINKPVDQLSDSDFYQYADGDYSTTLFEYMYANDATKLSAQRAGSPIVDFSQMPNNAGFILDSIPPATFEGLSLFTTIPQMQKDPSGNMMPQYAKIYTPDFPIAQNDGQGNYRSCFVYADASNAPNSGSSFAQSYQTVIKPAGLRTRKTDANPLRQGLDYVSPNSVTSYLQPSAFIESNSMPNAGNLMNCNNQSCNIVYGCQVGNGNSSGGNLPPAPPNPGPQPQNQVSWTCPLNSATPASSTIATTCCSATSDGYCRGELLNGLPLAPSDLINNSQNVLVQRPQCMIQVERLFGGGGVNYIDTINCKHDSAGINVVDPSQYRPLELAMPGVYLQPYSGAGTGYSETQNQICLFTNDPSSYYLLTGNQMPQNPSGDVVPQMVSCIDLPVVGCPAVTVPSAQSAYLTWPAIANGQSDSQQFTPGWLNYTSNNINYSLPITGTKNLVLRFGSTSSGNSQYSCTGKCQQDLDQAQLLLQRAIQTTCSNSGIATNIGSHESLQTLGMEYGFMDQFGSVYPDCQSNLQSSPDYKTAAQLISKYPQFSLKYVYQYSYSGNAGSSDPFKNPQTSPFVLDMKNNLVEGFAQQYYLNGEQYPQPLSQPVFYIDYEGCPDTSNPLSENSCRKVDLVKAQKLLYLFAAYKGADRNFTMFEEYLIRRALSGSRPVNNSSSITSGIVSLAITNIMEDGSAQSLNNGMVTTVKRTCTGQTPTYVGSAKINPSLELCPSLSGGVNFDPSVSGNATWEQVPYWLGHNYTDDGGTNNGPYPYYNDVSTITNSSPSYYQSWVQSGQPTDMQSMSVPDINIMLANNNKYMPISPFDFPANKCPFPFCNNLVLSTNTFSGQGFTPLNTILTTNPTLSQLNHIRLTMSYWGPTLFNDNSSNFNTNYNYQKYLVGYKDYYQKGQCMSGKSTTQPSQIIIPDVGASGNQPIRACRVYFISDSNEDGSNPMLKIVGGHWMPVINPCQ